MSDVLVPLAESAITGLLVAALVTAIAALVKPGHANGKMLFLIAWLVATTGAWLLILRHARSLLWSIERTTSIDIDRDGAIGRPGQRVILMNPRRAQAEAEKRTEQEERQRFKSFVGSLAHRGTDLRAWEKIIGREQYAHFRDSLFAEGCAQWVNGRNDRNGWKLAVPVDEILKSIVE